jgi:hypothetical protein
MSRDPNQSKGYRQFRDLFATLCLILGVMSLSGSVPLLIQGKSRAVVVTVIGVILIVVSVQQWFSLRKTKRDRPLGR